MRLTSPPCGVGASGSSLMQHRRPRSGGSTRESCPRSRTLSSASPSSGQVDRRRLLSPSNSGSRHRDPCPCDRGSCLGCNVGTRVAQTIEDEHRGGCVSSDIVGPLERASETRTTERRSLRALAIESLGPVTILGGGVGAFSQPSRFFFFPPAGKGFYDSLLQPPLLVIGVGLFFALVIAPGLLDDLRAAHDSEG